MKTAMRVFLILSMLVAGFGFPQAAWSEKGAPAPLLQDGPVPGPGSTLFLPLVNLDRFSQLTGKVVDEANRPLENVTLIDDQGRKTETDAQGIYKISTQSGAPLALAAYKEGYSFMPSMISLDGAGRQSSQIDTILAMAACEEKISNGSFAAASLGAWQIPITALSARLDTTFGHTDTRSIRTGILEGQKNLYSYSDVYQSVTLPRALDSAMLRLWLYPVSPNTANEPLPDRPSAPGLETPMADASVPFGEAPLAGDVQYVMVLDANGNILDTLLWMRSNSRAWTLFEFNLSRYAGRTIRLQIGTYNDGVGGVTAMYVDDVSLSACTSSGSPGPGTGCVNGFNNSSFESDSGWIVPITSYTAGYSTLRAYAGARSMRTGIVNAAENNFSYSDAYQVATIPSTATTATLNMWVYPISTGGAAGNAPEAAPERPRADVEFGTQALADDAQYVLVLNTAGYILEYLYWDRSNLSAWTPLSFDLSAYKGRTIRIQFGSFNNNSNGVTSLFVDQASLDICTGTPPTTPTPTPTTPAPTPTPTTPPPTPTPRPTPVPGSCAEAVANGTFETASAWNIPRTAFTAGYSNRQVHTGAQSMRSGIIFSAHDRYSYSDFSQTVVLPRGSQSATLRAWIYQETEDLHGKDRQYVLVLNSFGYWIDTLYLDLVNQPGWVEKTFDLSSYISATKDETLTLQFGVFNDGLSGVSSMFVDDVSLQVCYP